MEPEVEDGYDVLVEWLRDQVQAREPRVLRKALEPAACLQYLNGGVTRFWLASLLNPSAKSHRSWFRAPHAALSTVGWEFLSDCVETYTWLPLTNDLLESLSFGGAGFVLLTLSDTCGAYAVIWRPGVAVDLKRATDLSDEEASPNHIVKRVKLPTQCHVALFWDDEAGAAALCYNDRVVPVVGAGQSTLSKSQLPAPLYYQFTPLQVLNHIVASSGDNDMEDSRRTCVT